MSLRVPVFVVAGVVWAAAGGNALAQDGGASLSLDSEGANADASADAPGAEPGGEAQRPLQYHVEVGLYAGVMFPASDHTLYIVSNPYQDFDPVALDVGGRLGIWPFDYVGVEGEAGLIPTQTENDNSATLYTLRAHLVGQYPTESFTPFLVAGAGRMYVDSNAMGNESDLAYHFGIGAKIPITAKHWMARVDLRDVITDENNSSDVDHWPELLLGVSYGFDIPTGGAEEPPPPPPPADSDGDGKDDNVDACPNEPANTPDGCPEKDGDGDGIVDGKDACPAEAGIEPDGCPDKDSDKDGVPLPDDKCPEEAGVAPDGCPDLDADKDGIPVPADKCPDQPETMNGFQDADGCADEVPDAVKNFTGVIKGINFATGKAIVSRSSYPLLDRAVAVLQEYPELRLEIAGHTDSTGDHDKNVELSERRAEAVKTYLVGKGVDESRLQTRGAGPDEPIADNKTREGRTENRRIEFKMLEQGAPAGE